MYWSRGYRRANLICFTRANGRPRLWQLSTKHQKLSLFDSIFSKGFHVGILLWGWKRMILYLKQGSRWLTFYKRIVAALKTHKFCTFGGDLACRVTLLGFFHGRIAVSVMKEYWANYISLEEGLQSSRFKPGRPSSTKSTNRKMNLIERLLRKSPRNRSTESPLGKFHPEYLIQPANQWFRSSFQHMLIFWQYP